MTTSYTMNFTDGYEFLLAPYTTDGPETPNSNTLDPRAVTASSTLLLYGKGANDYGERIQENLLHMLENFASTSEPQYPIGGQLWYDTSDNGLQVFNTQSLKILPNRVPNELNTSIVTVAGDQVTRFLNLGAVRIFHEISVSGKKFSDYTVSNLVYDSVNDETYFTIFPSPNQNLASSNNWIGEWEKLFKVGAPFEDNLDLDMQYKIINLNTSLISNLTDVVNAEYVGNAIDDKFIAGGLDSLGDVIITNPTNEDIIMYDTTISPALWVNKKISSAGFLPLSGGTMSGNISLGSTIGTDGYIITNSRNTTIYDSPYTLATKGYVDTVKGPDSGGANYLPQLLDVEIDEGNKAQYDFISYKPRSTLDYWENVSSHLVPFITNSLPLSGTNYDPNDIATNASDPDNPGRMTGPLILSLDHSLESDWGDPYKAVSVDYMNNALATSKDGYVKTMRYDYTTSQFVIVYSQPVGDEGDISYEFVTDVRQMNHYVEDPMAMDSRNAMVEQDSKSTIAPDAQGEINIYPKAPMGRIVNELSRRLGNLSVPRGRTVIKDLGILEDDTYTLPFEYVVGHNALSVYVDGLRKISSEFGRTRLAPDVTTTSVTEPIKIIDVDPAVVSEQDALTYEAFLLDGKQTDIFTEGYEFEVINSFAVISESPYITDPGQTNDGMYVVKYTQFIDDDPFASPPVVANYTQVLVDPVPSGGQNSTIPYPDTTNGDMKVEIDPTVGENLWGGFPLWSDPDSVIDQKFAFRVSVEGTEEIVVIDPIIVRTIGDMIMYVNEYAKNFRMIQQNGYVFFYSNHPNVDFTSPQPPSVEILEGVGTNPVQIPIDEYQSGEEDTSGILIDGEENFIRFNDENFANIFTSGLEIEITGDAIINGTYHVVTSEFELFLDESVSPAVQGMRTTVNLAESIKGTHDDNPLPTTGQAEMSFDPFFETVTGGRYLDSNVDGLTTGERRYFYTFDPLTLNGEFTYSEKYDFSEIGNFGELSQYVQFHFDILDTEKVEVIADNSTV